MTDDLLTPEDLAEIERKVARFREMVTKAARRRRERAGQSKRAGRAALDEVPVQISILERLVAGTRYTTLATEYRYSANYLSSHMRGVVLDQMRSERGHLDDNSEWSRCLFAPRAEFREIWMPLALARLRERRI